MNHSFYADHGWALHIVIVAVCIAMAYAISKSITRKANLATSTTSTTSSTNESTAPISPQPAPPASPASKTKSKKSWIPGWLLFVILVPLALFLLMSGLAMKAGEWAVVQVANLGFYETVGSSAYDPRVRERSTTLAQQKQQESLRALEAAKKARTATASETHSLTAAVTDDWSNVEWVAIPDDNFQLWVSPGPTTERIEIQCSRSVNKPYPSTSSDANQSCGNDIRWFRVRSGKGSMVDGVRWPVEIEYGFNDMYK